MVDKDIIRNDTQSATLKCYSGEIAVSVGDTFHRVEPSEDWTVAGFGTRFDSVVVLCRPAGRVPGWAQQFVEADGTVPFCDDSVAAYMLERQDGQPRDARGYPLQNEPEST